MRRHLHRASEFRVFTLTGLSLGLLAGLRVWLGG